MDMSTILKKYVYSEYFLIKTSDKKYERRFDRSTVIFKFKFMDKIIPHIYNF